MRKLIERNLGVMMTLGLLIGLVVGEPLAILRHYVVFGLVVLLFLALLKADFSLIVRHIKNPLQTAWLTFAKLILLPIIVYFITLLLPAEFRIALVLLAATPAAMATPGLLVALKGEVELGFLVSILTSFLAPFTLPLVLYYTVQTTVDFDVKSMTLFLVLIVAIPLVVTYIFKRFLPKSVEVIKENSLLLLTLNLFLFNISVTAPYRDILLENLSLVGIDMILVIALSIFFHLVALLFTISKKYPLKMTTVIIFAYFNTGLSIVIAQQYFDVNTLMITILYELVWNVGMIFLQRWAQRHV